MLYASAYQRRRHVWTVIDGGPESGALQVDGRAGRPGGRSRSGCPRMWTSVASAWQFRRPTRTSSTRVVEAADGKGGFYRSTDRGETLGKAQRPRQLGRSTTTRSFGDPRNVDRVYAMDTWPCRSARTAARPSRHSVRRPSTWTTTRCGSTRPTPTTSSWVATVASTKRSTAARTGGFSRPSPVTQFYRVGVDNAQPFYSSTAARRTTPSRAGQSRTITVNGIQRRLVRDRGGDGFVAASTRPTPASCTPNRSTADSSASTGRAARRSTSSRARATASPRCAGTGTRR